MGVKLGFLFFEPRKDQFQAETEKVRKSMEDLIAVLEKAKQPWFWDARHYGGYCHAWVCMNLPEIEAWEEQQGKNVFKVKYKMMDYLGSIPWFVDHAVIEVIVVESGRKFYIDRHLAGGWRASD